MLWTKVVLNSIFNKKLSGRLSLSPSEVELGASKDCHFWNIVMHWNGKVHSLEGWRQQKIPKISKNASNKNYSELNFLQKLTERMSLSPGVQLGTSKDCHFLNIIKYWNGKADPLWGWKPQKVPIVLEQNCIKLNFQQKTWWASEGRGTRDLPFWCTEMGH